MTPISLLDLQKIIGQTIDALPDTYWVVAEINELKLSQAQHCYLELVQRNQAQQSLEAKANATIWANVYRSLAPYFADAAGRPLAEGMKVLLRVAVQYHALYGLQLNVIDIDPAYTVGEVELQRQQTLARLQAEGVMEMNKALPLPLLPQRIAVISSENAAGYDDFLQQLHHNPAGYRFCTTLFAANVQGKNAEQSIIAALGSIYEQLPQFDLVAILRGGGSQSDLSCFDAYELAYHAAQFPLPIITGIGHTKDTSVTDCVAHTMLKTPTAAAEFLIQLFEDQEDNLSAYRQQLTDAWEQTTASHKARLQQLLLTLNRGISTTWSRQYAKTNDYLPQRLRTAAAQAIARERNRLQQLQTKTHLLDPQNILQRGYSITLYKGKPLCSAGQVQAGDQLRTLLKDGEVISNVKLLTYNL
ncbi:exodeoxyribonuclease 7 large subunit [Bacteroidia bacterium]|nr:exodeoxyribonuclease 7 large subunit [Bacteroidia bacterium]